MGTTGDQSALWRGFPESGLWQGECVNQHAIMKNVTSDAGGKGRGEDLAWTSGEIRNDFLRRGIFELTLRKATVSGGLREMNKWQIDPSLGHSRCRCLRGGEKVTLLRR